MFSTWCKTGSTLKVAKKCKVSHTTVLRYKKRYDWDERKEQATKVAIQRVQTDLEKATVRHIKLAHLMQGRAAESLVKTKFMKPKDAIAAAVNGIKIEREILTESTETKDIVITVKLPKGMEDL